LSTYKRYIFFAATVLLLVSLVACHAPEDSNTYIIGDEQGDWGYPSPFAVYPRGPGLVRMSYIFDTLVWKDEDGFVGALADEWSFDESELAYTFQLREGVKWHDGSSFSADDVIFTYRYLQEHSYPFAETKNIDEVKKTGDNEVKIFLKNPDASFINNIAGVIPVLPEHIWKDIDEPGEFTEPEAVIGTGPYRLEEYNREQGLYRYSAFKEYYLGKPEVENLLMVKVSDPQLELERGEVDYARVQPEAVSSLEEQGFVIDKGPHDWTLKLMFNHQESPFHDKDFRHALAYGLDLEELVERALRGHGLPGNPGMISPDSRWYCEDIPEYTYNPQKAKEKLEEAGYHLEEGRLLDEAGEQVTLELLVMSDYAREGEIAGRQLEEMGFEVEIRSSERSVIDDAIRGWNFDLAITGHGGMGGDPEILQRFMVGESSPHLNARYDHTGLKDLLKKQSREMNPDNRKDLVREVQRVYAEELPSYSLHYPAWYHAYTTEVDWFFTRDGIGSGTPLPLNKLALKETED